MAAHGLRTARWHAGLATNIPRLEPYGRLRDTPSDRLPSKCAGTAVARQPNNGRESRARPACRFYSGAGLPSRITRKLLLLLIESRVVDTGMPLLEASNRMKPPIRALNQPAHLIESRAGGTAPLPSDIPVAVRCDGGSINRAHCFFYFREGHRTARQKALNDVTTGLT